MIEILYVLVICFMSATCALAYLLHESHKEFRRKLEHQARNFQQAMNMNQEFLGTPEEFRNYAQHRQMLARAAGSHLQIVSSREK